MQTRYLQLDSAPLIYKHGRILLPEPDIKGLLQLHITYTLTPALPCFHPCHPAQGRRVKLLSHLIC